ncbi:MAG TPA: CheR family methyltransferase, partial [Polyangiaceae bacterium]|nr:CheR family methyltransferase [Polyangiaceae bacterium]
HFQRGAGKNAELARAKEELRRLIRFNPLNLLGTWPVNGPFDAIFCRNVVIYFDVPTRERLVRRFASLLRPGGYLFMGHSESLTTANCPELVGCGRTTYVKKGEGAGA